MNHFNARNSELYAEDVSITEIAQSVGTPFYCYSTATLERHFEVFKQALPPGALIAFAVKANGNLSVLRTLARLGAGADIVSGGELKRALSAGIPANRIVFSGVGKTESEIGAAMDARILQFNAESEEELEALSRLAVARKSTVEVSLRINPDVDALTHAKISTGKAENKFGISWPRTKTAFARAARLPGLAVCGVAVHIGSQITDLAPFRLAFGKVAGLVSDLRDQGHKISRVDLGGGLGVPYELGEAPPLPADYGQVVREAVDALKVKLILEPGRVICANAGVLISRVTYVKKGDDKEFIILDAGMNDLIRPALYDAHHAIVAVKPRENSPFKVYDIVGPVCESADLFARDRHLRQIQAGDLVAILSAGAYGAVQSSSYNARDLAPEVLVNGRHFAVTRPRYRVEDMIAREKIAPWLN